MTVEERYLASLCIAARHMGKPTRTHPSLCSYCTRSLEELERLVSAPAVAGELVEWNRLDKHQKAARLDAARVEARMFSDLDL